MVQNRDNISSGVEGFVMALLYEAARVRVKVKVKVRVKVRGKVRVRVRGVYQGPSL